jgi:hypothetical protein
VTARPPRSPNFQFLAPHDPLLVALAAQAERYFADDPAAALIKLRQFAEVLARRAAAMVGVYAGPEQPVLDLVNRLMAPASEMTPGSSALRTQRFARTDVSGRARRAGRTQLGVSTVPRSTGPYSRPTR